MQEAAVDVVAVAFVIWGSRFCAQSAKSAKRGVKGRKKEEKTGQWSADYIYLFCFQGPGGLANARPDRRPAGAEKGNARAKRTSEDLRESAAGRPSKRERRELISRIFDS